MASISERIRNLEKAYREKGQYPTYNELFFDENTPDWRHNIEAETEELRKFKIHLIEQTVRNAMLSEGKGALARHLELGGVLTPGLTDFLIRHLRNEPGLLPRGVKRTDKQLQKEQALIMQICRLHLQDGLSIYAAISKLMDDDRTLNRKNLEALISAAKGKSRWGIGGLYSVIFEYAFEAAPDKKNVHAEAARVLGLMQARCEEILGPDPERITKFEQAIAELTQKTH